MISLIAVLAACAGGSADDSAALSGGDTCTALTSGTWTVTGPAWGMGDNPMDGTLTMDADDCSFTLGAWDMSMDDLPNSGVLDGEAVTLDGLNSYWRSCVGTASDENTVSGTCDDDGDAFEMVYAG